MSAERTGHAVEPSGARTLPAFAEDGTDLTVIRWMPSLSAEERLAWLETHLQAVTALRRDRPQAPLCLDAA